MVNIEDILTIVGAIGFIALMSIAFFFSRKFSSLLHRWLVACTGLGIITFLGALPISISNGLDFLATFLVSIGFGIVGGIFLGSLLMVSTIASIITISSHVQQGEELNRHGRIEKAKKHAEEADNIINTYRLYDSKELQSLTRRVEILLDISANSDRDAMEKISQDM